MKVNIKKKAFGSDVIFSDLSLTIKEGVTSFIMGGGRLHSSGLWRGSMTTTKERWRVSVITI